MDFSEIDQIISLSLILMDSNEWSALIVIHLLMKPLSKPVIGISLNLIQLTSYFIDQGK